MGPDDGAAFSRSTPVYKAMRHGPAALRVGMMSGTVTLISPEKYSARRCRRPNRLKTKSHGTRFANRGFHHAMRT
jgi:hypothetical protein